MAWDIDSESRRVLEANWSERWGFTMPNPRKYPYQWLWDSCFHAISWARLGDPRAVREMEAVFRHQFANGFVPNMGYDRSPHTSTWMWRHRGASDITQPPMYGHALRVLHERGFDVGHLTGPATAGLEQLFRDRLDPATGLIRIVHPWESGADDSARWESWMAGGHYSRKRWNIRKLVYALKVRLHQGAANDSAVFNVASMSFNALVAFNARELAAVTGDAALMRRADALAAAIDRQWSDQRRTWVDVDINSGGPRPSSSIRTLDALLPVLVTSDPRKIDAVFADVTDPRRFGRPFGPSGTSVDEPTYNPSGYWRGDAWPPVGYLIWLAAERAGRPEARAIGESLVRGAEASGMAEHWNPENGRGLGAIPQGWTPVIGEVAEWLRRRPLQSAYISRELTTAGLRTPDLA